MQSPDVQYYRAPQSHAPLRVDVSVPVIMQFVTAVVTAARRFNHDVLLLTKDEGTTGLERVAGAAMVLNIFLGCAVIDVGCPRCGERFFWKGRYYNARATSCRHCGLPIGASPVGPRLSSLQAPIEPFGLTSACKTTPCISRGAAVVDCHGCRKFMYVRYASCPFGEIAIAGKSGRSPAGDATPPSCQLLPRFVEYITRTCSFAPPPVSDGVGP